MKLKITVLSIALIGAATVFAADTNDALHIDWINASVSPSQDFYQYANGTWLKNNPIPADYSSWGSFNILADKVQEQIHALIQAAANDTKATPGSTMQKVGDFYYSGMDLERINKLGVSPLKPEFDKIDAVQNTSDLLSLVPHFHTIGVDVLFGFGSMQDYKNSQNIIAAAVQGGLGLPDRDYYLKDDAKFVQIRKEYVAHVAKMLELLGDSPEQAAKQAKAIMDIETKLASASMTQVAQRDPHAVYHVMNVTQVDQNTPNFSWQHYLTARGLEKVTSMNLAMPDFFKAMGELLQQIPLADWKAYFRWHLLDSYAAYLSQPFVDQNFKMVSALTGTEKILPRWKRVISTESGALGFAIGKLYVEKYFPPQAKQQVLDMIKNIKAVLRQDLANLPWMSPATKKAALKKLDKMEVRVGYPSKWRGYSSLKVDRDAYALNVMRANEFLTKRDLNKIGKPLDRSEWEMTPQTINAYYDPSMNSINFPAGILQAPFFDPKAPMALNYGSIGFVMGHEMTHGFDDQGSQFDAKGNLNNWWTPEDAAKFKQATQCIIDQFSEYTVDGGMHVQGKLVVGEAAADLGGITLAYRAFHKSKDYAKAKTINGLTPDQQFFLGTAHVWATNIRAKQLQNQVTMDPHPPAAYRVNGSLANIPQFKNAFGITDSNIMVRKKQCIIW